MVKKPEVVKIPHEYRDSLGIELLDYKASLDSKERPYFYKVPFSKEFIVLIPIRSCCSQEYIPIISYSRKNKKPGLDFLKMLLYPTSRESELSKTTIAKESYRSILSLEKQIERKTFKTIERYKKIIIKSLNPSYTLTDSEKLVKIKCTLQYFHNEIGLTEEIENIKIEQDYKEKSKESLITLEDLSTLQQNINNQEETIKNGNWQIER